MQHDWHRARRSLIARPLRAAACSGQVSAKSDQPGRRGCRPGSTRLTHKYLNIHCQSRGLQLNATVTMGSTRELGLVGIIVVLVAVLLRGGEIPSLSTLLLKRSASAADEDVHHVCQHHLAQKTERTSQVYCPVQPEALGLGSAWVCSAHGRGGEADGRNQRVIKRSGNCRTSD